MQILKKSHCYPKNPIVSNHVHLKNSFLQNEKLSLSIDSRYYSDVTNLLEINVQVGCGGSYGSAVVECLTGDRGAAGSSLTGITALCPLARHVNPSLVLVQPRKTRPAIYIFPS